nr:hypothetical protein [Bacteroidota bacterium]
MEYNSSEFIFLGEVIEKNDTSFEFAVYETFKGILNDTVQFIVADCSIMPNKTEIWLIYANQYDDTFMIASQCGWSRSFNWPFSGNSIFFPKPPPQEISAEFLEILNISYTERALSELQFDIISLRQNNIQEEMNRIKKPYQESMEKLEKIHQQLLILKWSLLSMILLLVIMGIILAKYIKKVKFD